MSAAKVFRLREHIIQRGWQLTELYNDDHKAYLTRISGAIIDVGGEPRIWNLQVFLTVDEIQKSVSNQYDVWEHHFVSLIRQAEKYLSDASEKVKRGEYLHVEPAPNFVATDTGPGETREDASGPASEDTSVRHTGSGILDARGNRIS